jgi:hypothetical protein
MITIRKGATNSCIFTLAELTTIPNADYFIEVYDNQIRNTKLMWLNDNVSTEPARYNQYVITETTSEDLDDQKISLPISTYDYYVWQTNSATLSVDYATSIVESGMIRVTGTSSNTIFTVDPGINIFTV